MKRLLEMKKSYDVVIIGGVLQPDAGFARHDALVWAYGPAVRRFGIDIFAFSEVTGIGVKNGKVRNAVTTRGRIETPNLY